MSLLSPRAAMRFEDSFTTSPPPLAEDTIHYYAEMPPGDGVEGEGADAAPLLEAAPDDGGTFMMEAKRCVRPHARGHSLRARAQGCCGSVACVARGGAQHPCMHACMHRQAVRCTARISHLRTTLVCIACVRACTYLPAAWGVAQAPMHPSSTDSTLAAARGMHAWVGLGACP